jgi:cysteine desulfurase
VLQPFLKVEKAPKKGLKTMSEQEIYKAYLDHNATTLVKPEARAAMLQVLDFPANASSIHKAGRRARALLEKARAEITSLVNANDKSVIIFTSGATEANNLVLKGCGAERILVSAIEHPSVAQARPDAEIIPVLANGTVDLAALDRMLEGNDRQTLISVMLVNNETGVIQPLEGVMEIAKRRGALVHTDAVQAAGRIPLDLAKLGVDYMTLTSHKIGGPQGTGCLILSNCVSVAPMVAGGGQEKNMRPGTENLPAIAGFGVAAHLAQRDMAAFQKLAGLRDKLEAELQKTAPVKIFGHDAPRVANTSMFALPGAPSETQMIALDLAGICVSNGSACSSGTVKPSRTLKAMGATEAEMGTALRVSLGWNSTEKDVALFLSAWTEMYARIKARLSAA